MNLEFYVPAWWKSVIFVISIEIMFFDCYTQMVGLAKMFLRGYQLSKMPLFHHI